MRRTNRWFLYGPFLLAGGVLIAWFMIWRAGADAMRGAIAEFAEAAASEGASVTHAPLRARGFPFFLRGVVDDFSIAEGDRSFACARLYIDALPYQPDRVIFSCGAEALIGADGESWRLEAPDARASLERDAARGWLARLETGAVTARDGARAASIRSLVVNVGPVAKGDDRLDVALRALDIAPPDRDVLVAERIDAAARLYPPDAAARRRIEIIGLEAIVNEARLAAHGDVFLDGDGVNGRLDASVEKPVGLVRAMRAFGVLAGDDEARAAEAGLAMFAIAAGGEIVAPIEFDEDGVSIGGVSLGRRARAGQP